MYTLALPKLYSSFTQPSSSILTQSWYLAPPLHVCDENQILTGHVNRVTRLCGILTNYVVDLTIPRPSLFQAKEQLSVRIVGKVFNNLRLLFGYTFLVWNVFLYMVHPYVRTHVPDDPKLPGGSGEVPIPEWSAWRFDSYCVIFSLLDKIN